MYVDPNLGSGLFACIAFALNIAVPAAILYVLYKFYTKLKSIEDHLRNIEENLKKT